MRRPTRGLFNVGRRDRTRSTICIVAAMKPRGSGDDFVVLDMNTVLRHDMGAVCSELDTPQSKRTHSGGDCAGTKSTAQSKQGSLSPSPSPRSSVLWSALRHAATRESGYYADESHRSCGRCGLLLFLAFGLKLVLQFLNVVVVLRFFCKTPFGCPR